MTSMKKQKDTTAAEPQTNEWQAKAEEYLASWKRAQADFENYRRRTETQQGDLVKLARAEGYVRMTPILDDFRRAFAFVPKEEQESAWITGMRQVEKHFRRLLGEAGLNPIDEGEQFDPQHHEAIAYEEHPELPEGTIIDFVESGWKMDDRVIKPARVRVSRGKTAI